MPADRTPSPDGPIAAIENLKRELVAKLEGVLERRAASNPRLRVTLALEGGHEKAMLLEAFAETIHAPVRNRLFDAYGTDRYHVPSTIPPKAVPPRWTAPATPPEPPELELDLDLLIEDDVMDEGPTSPGLPSNIVSRVITQRGLSPMPRPYLGNSDWPSAEAILETMQGPVKKTK